MDIVGWCGARGAEARAGDRALVLRPDHWHLGLTQQQILPDSSVHWIIQVIHLPDRTSAIGMGEAISDAIGDSQVAKMVATLVEFGARVHPINYMIHPAP